MVGIYKITNNINNHCYIGQSRNIEKRWYNHKNDSTNQNSEKYNYPLYCGFRKYGIRNFTFEVLEECSIEELNEKEKYWIEYYKPKYNQTTGGDYRIVPQKLTYEQVQEIQKILIEDQNFKISNRELGDLYGVSGKDTIRDINVGRTWYNENLHYPLRISKFTGFRKDLIQKNTCKKCGKEISKKSTYCIKCYKVIEKEKAIKNKKNYQNPRVTREELKKLIREEPFTKIGNEYGFSDNAIRKWCKNYSLPYTKKEINSYNDEEWKSI